MFKFECERDNEGVLVIKISDDRGKSICNLATQDDWAEQLARAILFELQNKDQQYLATEADLTAKLKERPAEPDADPKTLHPFPDP